MHENEADVCEKTKTECIGSPLVPFIKGYKNYVKMLP